jgi:hypothetical protein
VLRQLRAVDRDLEAVFLHLLEPRRAGATICPSKAARAVAGEDRADWEPLMEPARAPTLGGGPVDS